MLFLAPSAVGGFWVNIFSNEEIIDKIEDVSDDISKNWDKYWNDFDNIELSTQSIDNDPVYLSWCCKNSERELISDAMLYSNRYEINHYLVRALIVEASMICHEQDQSAKFSKTE